MRPLTADRVAAHPVLLQGASAYLHPPPFPNVAACSEQRQPVARRSAVEAAGTRAAGCCSKSQLILVACPLCCLLLEKGKKHPADRTHSLAHSGLLLCCPMLPGVQARLLQTQLRCGPAQPTSVARLVYQPGLTLVSHRDTQRRFLHQRQRYLTPSGAGHWPTSPGGD